MRLAEIVVAAVHLPGRVKKAKSMGELAAMQNERLALLVELQKYTDPKQVASAIAAAFVLGEATEEFQEKKREFLGKS